MMGRPKADPEENRDPSQDFRLPCALDISMPIRERSARFLQRPESPKWGLRIESGLATCVSFLSLAAQWWQSNATTRGNKPLPVSVNAVAPEPLFGEVKTNRTPLHGGRFPVFTEDRVGT